MGLLSYYLTPAGSQSDAAWVCVPRHPYVRGRSCHSRAAESVRFRAEACGVPAVADAVFRAPGDVRSPPKYGARKGIWCTVVCW